MAATFDTDNPIINILGQNVGLGPVDRSLIPLRTRWINDFPTTRTLNADAQPRPVEFFERRFERLVAGEDSAVTFFVYDLMDMAPVGNAGLFDIDQRHRTCELGIGILEPSRRGKGLGTEAVILITDYAIRGLGMHNVQLAVLEYNPAGIRAYRKAGFREYGRRRESRFHNGRRWDMIFMDVIASEWDSPAMEVMLAPDAPRDTPAE